MIFLINWDYDKLEYMNDNNIYENKVKLDYVKLSEVIEEIIPLVYENGDLLPLLFEDLNVASKDDIFKAVNLPEVTDEHKSILDEKQRQRNIQKLKRFSRDLQHKDWYEYMDNEVLEFLKKYPQYEDILKKD